MKPRLRTLLIGRWTWYRPLVSLAFIYLLLAIFAVFFADRMIFLPPAPSYDRNEPGLVFIETPAGETLAAIHHPSAPGTPTILFSHGNAEDIGQLRELFDHWSAPDLGVLAYDYPGYGLSTGEPTEASATRAARAAWDFLTKEKGVPPGDIILVNPHFPALRSDPMAPSGASRRKQPPSSNGSLTPISPPSGPIEWLLQGPPAESNLLAAPPSSLLTPARLG